MCLQNIHNEMYDINLGADNMSILELKICPVRPTMSYNLNCLQSQFKA